MSVLASYTKNNSTSRGRARINCRGRGGWRFRHSAAQRWLTLLGLAIGALLLTGCVTTGSVSAGIEAYHSQAPRVKLGQSMDKVLSILQPTQTNIPAKFAKPVEEYVENGKTKKIYFFRSRSFPDGLVTDDEFTPYVFEDGVLIAIGWTAIGGPKTQAQSREQNYDYHFHGRIYHY